MQHAGAARKGQRLRLPAFEGILPIARKEIPTDVFAGLTLAAIGIPEVMGYSRIAGMPVETGLLTLFIPIAVFALLGSSRHLVVGADSATAAILIAGLSGLAVAMSPRYIALAEMTAILTGVILIVARIFKLGFIANFLSRTVLVGFLTGVGFSVAAGQLPAMLGAKGRGSGAFEQTFYALSNTLQAHSLTVAVSAGSLVVIIASRRLSRKIPGALIAVVGAIVASDAGHLLAHGVATIGNVKGGLPHFGFPSVPAHDYTKLLGLSVSLFVVIIAQSAATSRAYALRYDDTFDENEDLVGLSLANVAAGFSGTFVVNGSPTKTEIIDDMGSRSQIASLTTAGVVLIVLLALTAPLHFLPTGALAAVVFMVAVRLVDIKGLKDIYRLRRDEFVVAIVTMLTVMGFGVEQGVVLAIVVSMVNHLRRGYHPNNRLLVSNASGAISTVLPSTDARFLPGLIVYRFNSSLYYANASLFASEVAELARSTPTPEWLCLDFAAITDVDYSAAKVMGQLLPAINGLHVRVVMSEVSTDLKAKLDRYGLTPLCGGFYDTIADLRTAFEQRAHAGT
jgi:SulP family sulfate permease